MVVTLLRGALRNCRRVLRAVRWGVVALVVVGVLAGGLAATGIAAVQAAFGAALAATTGMQSVAGALRKEKAALRRQSDRLASQRDSARREVRRLRGKHRRLRASVGRARARTARLAARSIVSVPAKAAPVAGAVVVAGLTAYDLAEACATAAETRRATGNGYLPNEALERNPALGEAEADGAAGLDRFCEQNRTELAAVAATLEPAMAEFDHRAEGVWETAAELLEKTGRTVDGTTGWLPGLGEARHWWRRLSD